MSDKKYGRNAKNPQNLRYKSEGRKAKNKQRRMARTARKQPNNDQVRMTVDQRKEFDKQNATVNAERLKADKTNWAKGFYTSLKLVDGNFHRAVDRLPGKLDIRGLWKAKKEG
jgi:hypothetical protein